MKTSVKSYLKPLALVILSAFFLPACIGFEEDE
jgi:hypothetical protein